MGSVPNTEADLVFACWASDKDRKTMKEVKEVTDLVSLRSLFLVNDCFKNALNNHIFSSSAPPAVSLPPSTPFLSPPIKITNHERGNDCWKT